jgi:hypothetical protein
MLALDFIRAHPEQVQQAIRQKGLISILTRYYGWTFTCERPADSSTPCEPSGTILVRDSETPPIPSEPRCRIV